MNLDSMSEPEKERLGHWLRDQLGMSGWVSKMDNRELLWRLAEALKIDDLPMAGIEEALWCELEDRLYPEYDGEKVQKTNAGWSTPQGEIRYP
jgi:hypothetical protein